VTSIGKNDDATRFTRTVKIAQNTQKIFSGDTHDNGLLIKMWMAKGVIELKASFAP
jgi:hypothetical protein